MLLFFTCCTLTVPISLLNYPLSRCPKQFIGLGFDNPGILKGAKVQTYLLEKVCMAGPKAPHQPRVWGRQDGVDQDRLEVSHHAGERLHGGEKSNDGKLSVMERVMQFNQTLEAFGNAKILRNDNWSRFGKVRQSRNVWCRTRRTTRPHF